MAENVRFFWFFPKRVSELDYQILASFQTIQVWQYQVLLHCYMQIAINTHRLH